MFSSLLNGILIFVGIFTLTIGAAAGEAADGSSATARALAADSNPRFSVSGIDDPYAPPRWLPGEGSDTPRIVANGVGPYGPWACATCHMSNGAGRPNYGDLAGLNAEYVLRQMQAFRQGDRTGTFASAMLTPFAKAELVGHEDAAAAAAYYASLKPMKMVRIVETDLVPRTINGPEGLWLPKEGTEPLRNRIVTVPDNPERALARDPRVTWTAYVPRGSIEKGKALISGESPRIICAACHGPELKGEGDIPRIAGRYPSYIYRQLKDIKSGARRGGSTAAMQEVVSELSDEEMTSVAAYVGSLDP